MHIKRERRCVACREPRQQADMVRVVRLNGEFVIDSEHRLDGRGAYVCKNNECIALTIKKRLFNRSFKTNINEDLYKKLSEIHYNTENK